MTDETSMVIKIASGIVSVMAITIGALFAYIKRQHAKEIKAIKDQVQSEKEHSKELTVLHRETTSIVNDIKGVIVNTNIISTHQTSLLKEVKDLLLQKRAR